MQHKGRLSEQSRRVQLLHRVGGCLMHVHTALTDHGHRVNLFHHAIPCICETWFLSCVHSAVRRYAVLCCALLVYAVLPCAVYAGLCCAVALYAVLCCLVLQRAAMLCLCRAVRKGTEC